jgi:hypothetical protein
MRFAKSPTQLNCEKVDELIHQLSEGELILQKKKTMSCPTAKKKKKLCHSAFKEHKFKLNSPGSSVPRETSKVLHKRHK